MSKEFNILHHKLSGRNFLKKGEGFTLIEILIAIAIFITIATIVITAFVYGLRTQRQALAQQRLLDQASYLLEYMTRALRMAMKDDLDIRGMTANCMSGEKVNYEFSYNCLKFRNYENNCQEFCWVDADSGGKKIVEYLNRGTPNETLADLTPAELNVTSFNITDPRIPSSWKQPPDDYFQPFVKINLEIKGQENSKIVIETGVSQRTLDVQK